MLRFLVVCVAMMALSTQPSWVAAQEVPQPDPAVAPLLRLVGDWTGTGTLTTPAESIPLQGSVSCSATAGGFGVLCQATWTGPEGVPSMQDTYLFGHDKGDGLLHFYAVTNEGVAHDHIGSFGEDTFTFEHTGPMEGQIFSERISLRLVGDQSLHYTGAVLVGSEHVASWEVDMTR